MHFLETVNIYLPVNNNYATNEHKFVDMFVTNVLGKFIYTCLNKREYMYSNNHKITISEHIKNHAS